MGARCLEVRYDTPEALDRVLALGALGPKEGLQVAVVGHLVG